MRNKATLLLTSLCMLTSLLGAACGAPSLQEIDAQAERIAAPMVSTWQAQAPTLTPRPTRTPTPSPTPTVAPTTSPAPPSTPTQTTTPTVVPTPKLFHSLGTTQALRLAACCADSDLETIDPALVWEGDATQIVTEVFVGLTRRNEETTDVELAMADRWLVSLDGRVWTFHLRTDVPWVVYNPATQQVEPVTDAQGQVRYVTAGDFEYGIKRVLDPATDAVNADLLYIIQGAETFEDVGVTALDDSTLEIRLQRPAGYFDAIADTWLMTAQPAWQIEALGDQWTKAGNLHSYGPYVLKEWVHNSHLTLVENPYWPVIESVPQPTIQEITWQFMDPEQALAAYRTGDLDVIQVYQDDIATLQADPQLATQLAIQPDACTFYYAFNTQRPPFDDPTVRRAFSLAVDREALVDEVIQKNQIPAYRFSPPGLRAVPTREDYPTVGLTYNPDEAQELLDAVYPDRLRMPRVTLATTSYGTHAGLAESILAMWAEVLGIEVELELFDAFKDYLDQLEIDAPQIYRLAWCHDYDAHLFLGDLFHSETTFTLNYTHWSSDEFDSLLDQAAASTDTALRTGLYAQAEDILIRQEAVIIPLYWYTHSTLTQPYVQRTYSQINGIERLEKWAIVTQ